MFLKLNDGNKLPAICFGPGILGRGYKFHKGFIGRVHDKLVWRKMQVQYSNALNSAIEYGIRFFDYSAVYGREDLIANAIEHSNLHRSDFFLTTRVTNQSQMNGTVKDCFLRSLERYHTDYIDLLMFHWPVSDYFIKTWEELITLKEEGLCKSIGVANCHEHHIGTLIKQTGVKPAVNQVELHPLFSQKPLLNYCIKEGIQVEAYTSLGRMDERLLRLPKFKLLCKKYNVAPSQLILRWHIQNRVIPIFRSLKPERLKENLDIFSFEISKEDMSQIDSFNINSRLRYDPDNCDFSIL